jgi:hypothetical protein
MRHADAELQLWLANDRIARERHDAAMAALVSHGSGTPSLRQRAGSAVIALGERLAGDPGRTSLSERRLAGRAS